MTTAHGVHSEPPLHGLMAQFESANDLVHAADAVRKAGYTRTDAYSPFPIPEIDHALGIKNSKLPFVILAGGLTGCFGGFFMQWFANTTHYPLNIGGRPMNSWPMFIPITFEMTILLSSLTAVLSLAIANGLPTLYHPVFNVPSFTRACTDSFFLCIESSDPKFDRKETYDFLKSLHPAEVTEVVP